MKTLYVYTRNGCGGCVAVKNFLKGLEIPFVELNVTFNRVANEKLKRDGHKFVPQIYANDILFMPGGWNTIKTMRRHEILEKLK
jgi:glutaredoxin